MSRNVEVSISLFFNIMQLLNDKFYSSRRWSREQKAAVGSPVFGYMATASNTVKAPVVGAPPYQLTLEDRLRWAQIADVMAQANHYAVRNN